MNIAMVRSELERLQKTACIMITGAMKSAGNVLGYATTLGLRWKLQHWQQHTAYLGRI